MILYILVRNDLASMNSGKAIAQGGHAVSKFVFDNALDPAVTDWEREGGGFGTKISLACNEQQLFECVKQASLLNLLTDIVLDPSYPIRDGEVTHLIPLHTAAYVFVKNEQEREYAKMTTLGTLDLYP